jgi:hypothetical protein
MSRYVNIGELADQVMASVKTASTTKTAAVTPKAKSSSVGRELRKFAEDLRQMPDQDEVSDDDLAALMQDQEVQQLLEELQNNPELLQQLMAEAGEGDDTGMGGDMPPAMDPAGMGGEMPPQAAMGAPPGVAGPSMNPQDPDGDGDADRDNDHDGDGPAKSDDDDDGPKKAPPSIPGKTASELRKVAAYLRDNEKRFRQIRMLKAANMIQAATALKHLTGGSK